MSHGDASTSPSDLLNQGLRGGGMARIATFASSFLVWILLARSLGAADLGTFATALAVCGLSGVVASLQLATQLERRSTPDAPGRMLWLALGTGALATGCLVVGGLAIGGTAASSVVVLAPLAGLQPAQQVFLGQLAVAGRGRARVWAEAGPSVARILIVPAILAVTSSPEAAAVAFLLGEVVAFLGAAVLASRAGLRIHRPYARDTRRTLRAAVPLMLVAGAWLAVQRTDLLVLGTLEGPADVGQYVAVQRLVEVVLGLYAGLMLTFVPAIARARADDTQALFLRAFHIGSSVLVVPAAVVATWGDVAVGLIYGRPLTPPFAVPLFLGVGAIVHVSTGPVGSYLLAQSRDRLLVVASIVFVATNIGLSLLFGSLLGPPGVAAATAVSLVLMNVVYALVVWSSFDDSRTRTQIGLSFLRAVVVLGALTLARAVLPADPTGLVVAIAFAATAGLAATWSWPEARSITRRFLRATQLDEPVG